MKDTESQTTKHWELAMASYEEKLNTAALKMFAIKYPGNSMQSLKNILAFKQQQRLQNIWQSDSHQTVFLLLLVSSESWTHHL